MKISQADIVMVPGYTGADEDHWQSRWETRMKTARRVDQQDWHKPVVDEWTDSLLAHLDAPDRPIVLVAHSLGCHVVVQAVERMSKEQLAAVRGAFLVAPPDVENPSIKPKHLMTFGPYRRKPLPFPSVVVASETDGFCSPEVAQDMAKAWNSLYISARDSGHINGKSGHGPWPDGLLVFGEFMKQLDG